MVEKSQRPLIDRPRYVYGTPTGANVQNTGKPINKKNLNKDQPKRKVMDNKMQPPVSGSMKKVDEVTELKPPVRPPVRPPVKPKVTKKKETKKPPTPPRKLKVPKEVKKEDGIFKQMKDKFVGKSKADSDK